MEEKSINTADRVLIKILCSFLEAKNLRKTKNRRRNFTALLSVDKLYR